MRRDDVALYCYEATVSSSGLLVLFSRRPEGGKHILNILNIWYLDIIFHFIFSLKNERTYLPSDRNM